MVFADIMNARVLAGTAVALAASLCGTSADAALYDTSDVTKYGAAHHLKVLGLTFTLDTPGRLAVDPVTGLAHYTARVISADGGFDIDLALVPGLHAPRCYLNDCSGEYYTNAGVDPAEDWSYFFVDGARPSTLTGFGVHAGTVLAILPDKWFQLGLGAGGANVPPEGLAFSGWFSVAALDTRGTTLGTGDINGNLTLVPLPPAGLLLLGALGGLSLIRRRGD